MTRKTTKITEYGSEFESDSNIYDFNETNRFNTPNNSYRYLLRSGRDCLRFLAVNHKNNYKSVLLPALCCESMITPFEQNGYQIIFYRLLTSLKIDIADVLNKIKTDSVFLFQDYFGIPSIDSRDISLLKSKSDKVIIVKDLTHNPSEYEFELTLVDYIIISIRKWFSIPDGGILFSNYSLNTNLISQDTFFASKRELAQNIKSLYLKNGNSKLKSHYLNTFQEANSYIDNSPTISRIYDKSENILNKIDFNLILELRRRNAKLIKQSLRDCKSIFDGINLDEVHPPLYFPILVNNQQELQKKLAYLNIFTPIIWPIRSEANKTCKISSKISKSILAIPCDHRYDEQDIKKMIELIYCSVI